LRELVQKLYAALLNARRIAAVATYVETLK